MWNGKNKAITFSYDDGVTQDIWLAELFRKYGIIEEIGADRFCDNIDDAIEMASNLLKMEEIPTVEEVK